jgi:hypothetical protein
MTHDAFYAPHNLQGAPMPAQLLTLYDERVKIGDQPSPGIQTSLDIGPFSMSDLNTATGLKATLLFKVKAVDTVNLTMKFNNHTPVVNAYSFDQEPDSMQPRSWHETILASNLKKQQNHLHVSATGSGHVEISDIVLIYHAT